jgi:type II secretory pathway pseudopilin PulG
MARRLRLLSSDRPRDGEAGFALIEVIVSAAVLAMVALAVLAGVDAAGRSTGREKAKAVAVSLAEQDQERMRGIAAKQVTEVPQVGPFPINGASYTVESKAEWIDDSTGGTDSCANTGAKASYIRMTTTVRAGNLSSPVVISSLVEPPVSSADAGEGYLAVQVNDKDGKGVPSVAVHAAGPSTDDATTNQVGCAVFGKVGVGTYDFTLTKSGYVDEFGRSPGQKSKVDVAQDQKTVAAVKFDKAAPLTVSFETSNPVTRAALANTEARVSAFNSEAPSLLTWGDGVTSSSTMLINLFPFNTPYASIYTGSCDDADPLSVVGSTYYTSGYQGPFAAKPGVTGSITVHEPPVPVQVKRSGAATSSAKVRLTGTCDSGSGAEKFDLVATTASTPGAPSGQAGWATWSTTSYDPGLPYGSYEICVKTTGGSGNRWKQSSVALNDPTRGTSSGPFSIDTTTSDPTSNPDSTKCPS